MKKIAWTMAELAIAITVMVVLTAASMTIIKTVNINKAKIYMYTTIKNLEKGHVSIMEYSESEGIFYPNSASEHDNDASIDSDWYCVNVADKYTTKNVPNCAKDADAFDVNFTLVNDVSLYGMSSGWQEPYSGLFYKDIMVDVNSAQGPDKIGIDRFPLRIFRGSTQIGTNVDGIVAPVNCQNDVVYDADESAITITSPYCDGATNNIASSNDIITYDIYKVTNGAKLEEASMIIANKSSIDSDCIAYGATGLYGAKFCKEAGKFIDKKCAHVKTCENCGTNGICPDGSEQEACDDLATANELETESGKQGFECFTIISKPSSSLGLLGSLYGEVDL